MAMFNLVALIALVAVVSAETSDEKRILGQRYKSGKNPSYSIQLGPRPYYLVQSMKDSPLKTQLTQCANTKKRFKKSFLSVSHRGAPLMFPEHTLHGLEIAARMGADLIEADVTFTKDRELVVRHAQCDLHTTTDVLLRPELAAKCSRNWTGPSPAPAPKCCTSDFTLAEVKTMCAKMDAADSRATTREGYVNGGVASWRTTLYGRECPRVPTHKEYIQKVKEYGAKFVPEMKTPEIPMPYNDSGIIFTQTDYAQKVVDEYIEANIDPSIVYLQSFLWSDVIYWSTKTDFKNTCALEGTYDAYNWSKDAIKAWLKPLKDAGVPVLAPPTLLLANRTSANATIEVSNYASVALEMGFKIVTWSFERDGPLQQGGGFYNTGLFADRDGFNYEFLDFMVKKANITGIFSDWPATVTFYANCMGLGLGM